MRVWRRSLVTSVVAGVAAGGIVAVPAAAAGTARARSNDLIQLGAQLVNLNSRKCLTITAAGLADNAIVIQKECTRETADRWRFVRVPATGLFLIENVNSGKCLSIAGDSLQDNGFAVQTSCDDDLSRQWQVRRQGGRLLPAPATRALLENGRSHRCLTIAGGSDAEDGVAVQYACDAKTARQWEMRLVAGPALENRYRPSA
jgi:hypothetical protein